MTRTLDDLGVATAGATGVTTLAILARLQRGDVDAEAALPILVGAASIIAGLLLRRPAPSLAWLALVGGSLVASALPFERSRGADPVGLGTEAWTGLALQAAAAALVTLAIVARYATRPAPPGFRASVAVAAGAWAWLAIACVTTIGLIVTGRARADPAFTWVDVATAPLTYFLHLALVVTALGVAADVRAGMRRATDRGPRGAPGGIRSGRAPENLRALAVATLRELVPGQSAADAASLAAERTRLAGDLHAVVLPGLRQAIAEAESGGDPDALARRLRSIDLELERLMADRWPVVLDAFGLVPALEDLAERIEADGRQFVTLEIGAVAEQRPPPAVERTAWRVAQIALDNAVRHGGGTAISVVIATGPRRVRLVVSDDGQGFEAAPGGPVRKGGRGLADATRRAAEIGALLRIERAANGGTTVDFAWEPTGR